MTRKKARPPAWWLNFVTKLPKIQVSALRPKHWTPELARTWVRLIPAKCPFERELWLGNTLILYIPPLCPLNPLSTQLYSIRIEAQAYLLQEKILLSSDQDTK